MAHHAPVSGTAGNTTLGEESPRASVRARELPPQLREARDELFADADQHGPRLPVLLRRSLPALAAVPLTVALAASTTWRELLVAGLSSDAADAALVAPVLVVLVVLAAALAPLARVPATPLVVVGAVCIGIATWLVSSGLIAAATVPAGVGACLLGIAAARAVRRAVWMLPVLVAAGISDAQSVHGGVTRNLLAGVDSTAAAGASIEPVLRIAPDLVRSVDFVVIHVPAATGMWVLGLVDILAVGLLLGLSHLYWLPLPRTAVALVAALVLTMAFGGPIPVLPMLAIAWALVHVRLVWRATRFSLRRLTYLGG